MPSPIERARRRKAMLEAEIKQIQHFIEMYEAFENAADEGGEQNGFAVSAQVSSDAEAPKKPSAPVEKRRKGGKDGPTPKELVDIIERMIRDAGRPLTRGDITHLLDARDVEVPATDKPRYVGTIMWRNKSKFVNIEGRGYWLRGEPMRTSNQKQELSPSTIEHFDDINMRISEYEKKYMLGELTVDALKHLESLRRQRDSIKERYPNLSLEDKADIFS